MLRIFFNQRVFLLATWQLILASVVGGRGNIGPHAFRFPDKVACLQRQNLDASGRVMLAQRWMGTSVLKKINVQVFSQFWALLSHSLTKDSFWGYLWYLGHQFASSFLQLIGPPGGTTLLVSCRTSLLHAWCSFSWESPCPLQLPVARQAEERGRSTLD